MMIPRLVRSVLVAALGLLALPAAAQNDYGFMPKGGKALLLELVGKNAKDLQDVAGARRTEAEWREALAARQKTLSERDLTELAAYLSISMPVSADALEKIGKGSDVDAALPPDGRELAWTQCQYCHSLFSGYLMQQRDVQGWRSVFLSPFHRGMKMTAQERETFARYSTISMPMKKDDVPADLRY
jgi:hypothetical protein